MDQIYYVTHVSKGPMLACIPSWIEPNSIEITKAIQPKEQLTLQAVPSQRSTNQCAHNSRLLLDGRVLTSIKLCDRKTQKKTHPRTEKGHHHS
jgi:hypothetical protein